MKDVVTPYPFLPPNKNRICGVKNKVCYDKKLRRVEFEPTWYGVLITLSILLGGSTFFMWVMAEYMGYNELAAHRYFSVSYLSGIFGILAILYNIRLFRALFLSVSPVLFTLFPIIQYADRLSNKIIFGISGESFTWNGAIITHIPHYVLFVLLIMDRSPLHHKDFILSAIFWGVQLTIIFMVFPEFRMFYKLTLVPTLIIIECGCFVSWLIVFLMSRRKNKH